LLNTEVIDVPPENNQVESEEAGLESLIKSLTTENRRLSRELRVTKNFLDKIMQTMEAKDAFSNAMSAAASRQKVYTDVLLNNCPSIILLIDDNEHFVLGTKTFLSVCSIHNFNLIDRERYEDVFSGYMPEDVLARIKSAVSGVHETGNNRQLTEWIDFSGTGGSRGYSIDLIPVTEEEGAAAGIKRGVLAVFSDITELAKERDRSEAANNAKSDFLATMSHEIRTPMNAILGMSEMLGRGELSATQRKYVGDIQKSSQSLLSIINDILDFSKIEAGKLDIINGDYRLTQLLDNINSMFTLMFSGKSLPLYFSVDESVPASAFGDEKRLRQVLTNILSNSLKYTHEGGVWFEARLEGGWLRFDVKDTGIGIRDEDKEKLFKPFEQLDVRRNRNIVGTGLGLAISHRLCQLMSGELTLESVYGKGSTFSVRIPYAEAKMDAEDGEGAEIGEFSAPEARVLVVDDIDVNLTVAEAMLGAFMIEPALAEGGAQALEIIKEKRFDLIFMDQMMPGIDGIECTHRIRSMGGWHAAVPIIALTANAINGVEEMFLANSFDGYLTKPLDLAHLAKSLRRFLPKDLITE
jgi:signal transduction histidine kinase/CheY-like chemotaxis protein